MPPDDPTKDANKGLAVSASIIDGEANFIERLANSKPRPAPNPNGSWTVIVFMVVDDVLAPFAARDIQEMAMIASPGQLKVLACVHWGTDWPPNEDIEVDTTTRLQLPDMDLQTLDAPNRSRSVLETFKSFLAWAAATDGAFANEYPDKPHRTMLVLWGHGYGMRIGGRGREGMTIDEIRQALEDARSKHSLRLDILGFDACATSRVEVAEALGTVSGRVIGSQIGVPYSGWPYNTILWEIQQSPGLSPAELGEAILRCYYDSYRPPRVTLTMLNTNDDYGRVPDRFGRIVDGIASNLSAEVAQRVFEAFKNSRHDCASPEMDLLDFCRNLVTSLDQVGDANFRSQWNPNLRSETAYLISVLSGVQVIEDHEERGPDVAHLNGVGVSAHYVTAHPLWSGYLNTYNGINWPKPPGRLTFRVRPLPARIGN